jgi:hypothetical protein
MRHADSLEKFRTLAGERVMTTLVVCCAAKEQPLSRHVTAVPWQQYLEWLSQLT